MEQNTVSQRLKPTCHRISIQKQIAPAAAASWLLVIGYSVARFLGKLMKKVLDMLSNDK